VRAVASAVWEAGRSVRVEAGDDRARDGLRHWSLMQTD
jgi:glycerol-1-phosphatase